MHITSMHISQACRRTPLALYGSYAAPLHFGKAAGSLGTKITPRATSGGTIRGSAGRSRFHRITITYTTTRRTPSAWNRVDFLLKLTTSPRGNTYPTATHNTNFGSSG